MSLKWFHLNIVMWWWISEIKSGTPQRMGNYFTMCIFFSFIFVFRFKVSSTLLSQSVVHLRFWRPLFVESLFLSPFSEDKVTLHFVQILLVVDCIYFAKDVKLSFLINVVCHNTDERHSFEGPIIGIIPTSNDKTRPFITRNKGRWFNHRGSFRRTEDVKIQKFIWKY